MNSTNNDFVGYTITVKEWQMYKKCEMSERVRERKRKRFGERERVGQVIQNHVIEEKRK